MGRWFEAGGTGEDGTYDGVRIGAYRERQMFSQLLFVRLRAAEKALRDGQLDEAYRLATAPDLQEHGRGKAVLATLTERLLERAREHYRADRCTEALLDLDRAEAGGVQQDQIAELRAQVQTVAAELRRQETDKRDRVDAARRRIEGGSLAAGRRILEQVGERDHTANDLKRAADHRAADALDLVKLADKLMAQGQFAAAAERVRRAKSLDAHQEAVVRIESRLCKTVFDNTRGAILDGRIGRAADELDCLGKLGDPSPAKRELTDMLALAKQAGGAVKANRYADARRHVMSLQRMLPKAKWVAEVVDRLKRIDDFCAELNAGPLGEALQATMPYAKNKPQEPADLEATVALPAQGKGAGSAADRLLLLVDGGGSFLLIRGPQAAVGRAASNSPADIPVVSDIAERQANIARVDDDYFLFATKEVEVGGRKTKHQLLRDGDRIVLGRKAKFTFRMPSRQSATAVLEASETTKMPNDVRRVILFDRHATIGRGPTAHIQCRHAGTTLVLFERSGGLWVRAKNDGHVDTAAQELQLGQPVEMAGAGLVLERWPSRTPGSATI